MSLHAHNNTAAPPSPDVEFDNQFDELEEDAPLNPDSLDAQTINWLIAQLSDPAVSILDVAAALNCSPASLLEIITHAADFRSHIDAMRDLALLSAQITACAALPRHTDTLVRIADDESVHPETRRKAIGALIRLARGMSPSGATGRAQRDPSANAHSTGATSSLPARASCKPQSHARGQSKSLIEPDTSHRADSEPRASARACSSDTPACANTSSNKSTTNSESPLSCSPVQPSNSGCHGLTPIEASTKATPASTLPPDPNSPDTESSDAGFPDAESEQREDSDPSLQQHIDDLLILEDEALFAQARAAVKSLLGFDTSPHSRIRAGPESAVA